MSWIKRTVIAMTTIIISISFALVLFEISMFIWNYNNKLHILKSANVLTNFEFNYNIGNRYKSQAPTVSYTRNKYGLRDNCANPAEIKIITVGGSTTDQRMISYNSTYQSVIQRLIFENQGKTVCISNAGVDGHSTFGHLFALEKWFPLIPNFQPNFTILYIGVNDAYLDRIDTPNIGFDTVDNLPWKELLKRNSYSVMAILPLYRAIKSMFTPADLLFAQHLTSSFTASDYTESTNTDGIDELIVANTAAFEKRLVRLIELIRAQNSIPICVSQPHVFSRKFDTVIKGIPNVMGPFNGLDYDQSLKSLRNKMKEICEDNFIDIYSAKFEEKDFYDGVHTTPSGSEKIGEYIYQFFIDKSLLNDI